MPAYMTAIVVEKVAHLKLIVLTGMPPLPKPVVQNQLPFSEGTSVIGQWSVQQFVLQMSPSFLLSSVQTPQEIWL